MRVIVLTGEGRAFSAGADRSLLDPSSQEQGDLDASREFTELVDVLCRCPKPLLAAVNGLAVGIGCTMLLHCDLVLAAESARFRLPFTTLGLVPEAGSSVLLPARTRWPDAMWALLSSEWIESAAAREMGLVWRVVPDAELIGETAQVAATLAALDPAAVATTKRLVTTGRAEVVRRASARELTAMRDLLHQTQGMSEIMFADRHGVDVFCRHWPHPDPAGLVVIAHGASEHSGRYDRFARALVDAGHAAYALDHRGHGRTADATGVGRTGDPGGTAMLDDLDHVLDLALQEHGNKPVVLFGHSMGSMLALAYATEHPSRLAGLVLSGFAAPMEGLAAAQQLFQGAVDAGMHDEPVDLLAGLNDTFEPSRTPYDWLSRDEAEVDAYVADPFCGDDHPLTHGFVLELFRVVAPTLEAEALARISCPVLLVTGEQDPAAAMGENARALEAALTIAGVAVESRLYPDARHELLNEVNRDEVTADLVGWIDVHTSSLGRRPS